MHIVTPFLALILLGAAPSAARADCGDGRVDAAEDCDLGDGNGPRTLCSPTCTHHRCGDNFIAEGESCDDGNNQDGDGCDASCRDEQRPVWSDTVDAGGTGGDFFRAVARHEDRLFVVGGTTPMQLDETPSAILVAWEIDDGLAWTHVDGDELRATTFEDVAVTGDGVVVVVGTRRDPRPQPKRWIATFDTSGRPLADRIIDGEQEGSLLSIAVAPDGGLVVGGWSNALERDPWVAHVDAESLEVLWERSFPIKGGQSTIADVAVHGDGTIAVAGFVNSTPPNGGERWIACLSPTGTPRWEFRDTGAQQIAAYANGVAFGADGSVYAAGGEVTTSTPGDATVSDLQHDGWVSRFEDGTELWAQREKGQGLGRDAMRSVAVTQSGVVLALGSVQLQPLLVQTDSDQDALLVAYDTEGRRLWKSVFDGPLHTADEGAGLLAVADDALYVVGKTATAFEGDNGWIARFALPSVLGLGEIGDTTESPDPPSPEAPVHGPTPDPSDDRIDPEAATLYLNFVGGQLSPGEASDLGQVACIDAPLTYPGLPIDEAFAQAVADRVEAALSDYAVTVVWRHPPPAHLPYTTVMIGGDAEQIGLSKGTAGYACAINCFDRSKRDVAFAFAGGDPNVVAINALHEAAHTWGLDHVTAIGDIMSPFAHGGDAEWGGECTPISESTSSAACEEVHRQFCEHAEEQDSAAELGALFGARVLDEEPPDASILSPLEDEPLPLGVPIDVEVAVTDNLGNPGWKLEVPSLGITRVSRGGTKIFSILLPAGEHELRIVATDHQGNEAVARRSIRVVEGLDLPPDGGASDESGEDPTDNHADTDSSATTEPGGCACANGKDPGPLPLLGVLLVLLWSPRDTQRRNTRPRRRRS